MASPEEPNNKPPQGPPDRLSESGPIFQKYFIIILKAMLLDKALGTSFYDEYKIRNLRRALQHPETGEVIEPKSVHELVEAVKWARENPIIRAIGEEEELVRVMSTTEEVLELARQKGFEFTPEEIKRAKKETRNLLESDLELD